MRMKIANEVNLTINDLCVFFVWHSSKRKTLVLHVPRAARLFFAIQPITF